MKKQLVVAMLALAFLNDGACGAAVSFHVVYPQFGGSGGRAPTPAEIADDPSLAGHRVHEFRVTTDADILRVGDIFIDGVGSIYQVPFGTDVERPSPVVEAVFPRLGADSWITTPGVTQVAGNTSDPLGTDNNSWFDTTVDGPQTDFLFARLTTSHHVAASFRGVVSINNQGTPVVFPFSFALVPEPASLSLASVGLVGVAVGARRRWPAAWRR